MKKQTKPHNHKYERRIMGGRKIVYFIDEETGKRKRRIEKTGGCEVFRCVFPGCGSFFTTEMAVGHESICWTCGESLILSIENTRLKKPTHEWCRKVRVLEAGE